jgi:hypothetical protein
LVVLLERELDEVVSMGLTQDVVPYHFEELASVVVVSLVLVVAALAVVYRE